MDKKFLLFDLDHTLMDFDQAEEVALTDLLIECQIADIEVYKDYYKPMNQAMWKSLELKQITKPELVNTRFAKLFNYFGKEVDGIYMAERYQAHLKNQGQTYPGATQLLADIKAEGYSLYATTNGITKIQEGRLAHSDIETYFDKIFISEQSGSQKPDPAFYEWIAEQIPGFDSTKALMIGDSLTADIQGGNNAGIETVWYNPHGLENHSKSVPDYIIANYEQLKDLLFE
ncbi:YjjG family noncanonical pyrimidine nucleotidase [Streptococcus parauberis]|uniref:YjjG family noncanonical pyrimidine nucleotidase n=1 Tax=Streptococcus parauberis TaxID=1348 RepID=A0AAE4KV44_9STRE|nr:YjjG family noncanonical pyrimidine nucleotidase [Streptococcus parauberis]MDT2732451.1 YjjG family noncanonical pyrimidine nucleotidase [Streptococcus parauberis]